jgi:hypothetical protein
LSCFTVHVGAVSSATADSVYLQQQILAVLAGAGKDVELGASGIGKLLIEAHTTEYTGAQIQYQLQSLLGTGCIRKNKAGGRKWVFVRNRNRETADAPAGQKLVHPPPPHTSAAAASKKQCRVDGSNDAKNHAARKCDVESRRLLAEVQQLKADLKKQREVSAQWFFLQKQVLRLPQLCLYY